MGESETSLLTRCKLGENQAWETLFESFYAPACRFIAQTDPSFTREDVEEIAQETFLAVVRGLKDFNSSSQFLTWLYRIAMNKSRDYRDRKNAAKRGGGKTPVSLDAPGVGEESGGSNPVNPPSPLPGPDQVLIQQEHMELLRLGMDQLGDPCRDLLELRYFADLSYEEIATVLETNEKTVSSRLSRCLDALEVLVRQLWKGSKPDGAGQTGAKAV